ncbi:helix-turn-helix domain-containing protein [Mucilaginibacter segetis]|uniref:Helix-turn-helix transcriptional regulator n=1 Tax=Mucilaginibacter segetis TaxID=2793071 RepID=A0A934PRS7_9SPHI|nr:AraC family transcriptional regulator [Mucilaginibacter segetis]MBK0377855.1 helix-turn-helix transcriptional regulator [Mucilaginibacter segetis]
MLLKRETFNYKDQCVIEKLLIQPPHRFSTIFQDNACFLHFKNTDTVIWSATAKLDLTSDNTVLLKCGTYFADFIGNLAGEPSEVYAVHLYPGILKELYKSDFPATIKSNQEKRDTVEIKGSFLITHFIESLALYFDHRELMNPELLLLKMKEIVLLLMQTSNAGTVSTLFSSLYSPRHVTLSEVVENHLHSDLSISELASLSGLSLSTFKREFKKQFRDTPSNYLKDKRLEESKKLLLKTELSVSEICYKVGFKDIAHFSRSFKQKYKSSPSDFRSLNR